MTVVLPDGDGRSAGGGGLFPAPCRCTDPKDCQCGGVECQHYCVEHDLFHCFFCRSEP